MLLVWKWVRRRAAAVFKTPSLEVAGGNHPPPRGGSAAPPLQGGRVVPLHPSPCACGLVTWSPPPAGGQLRGVGLWRTEGRRGCAESGRAEEDGGWGRNGWCAKGERVEGNGGEGVKGWGCGGCMTVQDGRERKAHRRGRRCWGWTCNAGKRSGCSRRSIESSGPEKETSRCTKTSQQDRCERSGPTPPPPDTLRLSQRRNVSRENLFRPATNGGGRQLSPPPPPPNSSTVTGATPSPTTFTLPDHTRPRRAHKQAPLPGPHPQR